MNLACVCLKIRSCKTPPIQPSIKAWGMARSLTFIILVPEELLAVVGRVGFLHLGNAVPGHFAAQWGGEEGGSVSLGGRWSAEWRHLRKEKRVNMTRMRDKHAGGKPKWYCVMKIRETPKYVNLNYKMKSMMGKWFLYTLSARNYKYTKCKLKGILP